MELVTYEIQNGVFVFDVHGRVDSTNAGDFDQKTKALLAEHTPAQVVMDCEDLEYISSAGLRVLLKIKKAVKNFSLVNVSTEVYEILEITGFTEILTVEKAFRKISVDGCEVIGKGAFGTVYRLNEDTIVKVYEQGSTAGLEFIRREQETARKAFVYGMPTAISFDTVKVGSYYGVVYEMLDADTLGAYITKHPEKLEACAIKMAELAQSIHNTVVKQGDFQDARSIYSVAMPGAEWLLTDEEYQRMLELIAVLPERDTLIHGDFHTKNVMLRNNELELIDMGDVGCGHPIHDFSSMYSLYFRAKTMPGFDCTGYCGMDLEHLDRFWTAFCEAYFGDRYTAENKELLEEALKFISDLRAMPVACARVAVMPSPAREEVIKTRLKPYYIDPMMNCKKEEIQEMFTQLNCALF